MVISLRHMLQSKKSTGKTSENDSFVIFSLIQFNLCKQKHDRVQNSIESES